MLAEQILKTIKYFDVQNHPLTLLEIHKYLLADRGTKATVSEILTILETDLKDKIQTSNGFYYLTGRDEISEQRLKNNLFATKRLKRTKRYLSKIKYLPFITGIAVGGSEAITNTRETSDIDIFVLTKPNRIWLARLFLTAYFQILGVRRHGKKTANRFCLNHYIEQGKLLNREQHIYSAVEYISLIPYFGGGEIYEFQKTNLSWMKEYLAQPQIVQYTTPKASVIAKIFEKILDNKVGDFLENIAGKLQTKKIHLQDSIVLEKDELAFHPGNKGRQVMSKFNP
ncbi:MAG: hypothetical protein G01um101477_16 [Candidatus Doudnabacteria bacterium Gr01-1014_77]|uniref:Polymerase nucleotidyl transferase domain-containing protein n=1 Tax=Candidatus Doudnabacteria bacterium Gr01-1014_77 TaxID=2017133 RepID=A0A554JE97_9BACT|nr:MAG: hypothetical protein G01um101477_16 [Candidatus Doudnabacteria bacterium Gr01-1014_77]